MINITPLIDVVFVLLISFIVIAPLLELDRVELASGGGIATHLPVHFEDAGPIQIHVQRDNSLIFNGKKVSAGELSQLLRDAKMRYPTARPQLFHDKKAHFGTYQEVKNILEVSGYKELDIVLLPS
jgi:biopolymer transport protein ExbD